MTRFYKWGAGSVELLLGIPFVGGAYILSTGWSALGVMLIIHILGLILCVKTKKNRYGHTLGIVTSILGVIPAVGMILHLFTGAVLIYEALQEERQVRADETVLTQEAVIVPEAKTEPEIVVPADEATEAEKVEKEQEKNN